MDDHRVKALLDKAVAADKGGEAMNFAQAACNAANAMRVLVDIATEEKK